MPDISLEEIELEARAALVAHGAAEWIADHVAHAIRIAEATGNKICGLYYLESYCQQLLSGRVRGDADPVVTQPRPGAVHVDAGFGFAQPAFARGLARALETARDNGIALFSVARAHTCTSLGYFTHQIAEAGMIGIGMTNASAVVAPPGGTEAVLGTNPVAMAVPDGQGGVRFQFDQSTTAIARGKITQAAAAGQDIPLGWAVDKDGAPTTDPQAALAGTQVSSGGYKGWGIGLMVEVLAAALTGGNLSTEVGALKAPEGAPHNLGQTYILIDPHVFGADVMGKIDAIEAAVTAQEGARLPGAHRALQDPVSLDAAIWDLTRHLAKGPA